MSGVFVVLEGIDGSGKTTLARELKDELDNIGIPSILTSEPGGYIPELKNLVVVRGREEEWDERAILHMFLADRYLHIQKVIQPALDDHKIVICDRYEFSTLVYQKEQVNWSWYPRIPGFSDTLKPDIVFHVQCPPDVARQRLIEKYGTGSHCDSELDLAQLKADYEAMFYAVRVRPIDIDSTVPISEIIPTMKNEISKRMKL